VPIFTIFLPYERYLREFSQSGPLFPIPQGRCYGSQFWTKFAKWPLLNTLAFRNGFDYRKFDFKKIQWQYFLYIQCKFDQDWSSNPREIADCASIWRASFICHLAFRNVLECHNFDFCRLTGNHFCTLCENLVRFGSVTPEF